MRTQSLPKETQEQLYDSFREKLDNMGDALFCETILSMNSLFLDGVDLVKLVHEFLFHVRLEPISV